MLTLILNLINSKLPITV